MRIQAPSKRFAHCGGTYCEVPAEAQALRMTGLHTGERSERMMNNDKLNEFHVMAQTIILKLRQTLIFSCFEAVI